jgi:uncharacterized protein (TIGR01777 family)
MRIIMTGSTGLIGSSLVSFLTGEGHEVLKIVRGRSTLQSNEVAWDPDRGVISPEKLEDYDAVVHLAGENIGNGRWTEEKKKRIIDSRVKGTKLLCETLANLNHPPKLLVSASAIGYYGDQGETVLTEQSPIGKIFVSYVCQQWESSTRAAFEKGIRVVFTRIGVVLSPKGGALQQLLTPFKLGLGGVLGSGKQYYSWIALDDVVNAIYFALQHEQLKGPVNLVSPNPVTNEEFTKTLGKVLNRPTFAWVPAPVARMMFGELANELLLASIRVKPEVLLQNGFNFSFPQLEKALEFLLNESS